MLQRGKTLKPMSQETDLAIQKTRIAEIAELRPQFIDRPKQKAIAESPAFGFPATRKPKLLFALRRRSSQMRNAGPSERKKGKIMGAQPHIPLDSLELIDAHGKWQLYRRSDCAPTPPYEKMVLLAKGVHVEQRRYHLTWDTERRKLIGQALRDRRRIQKALKWALDVMKG